MIDQAYDRKSWHGTNLRGSIRGLDAAIASWRPATGRHNIWEIVVHAAYWKYVVKRRITGEKRGTFPLKGSNWFERPGDCSDINALWKADRTLLGSTHRDLRDVIAGLKPVRLAKAAHGGRETVFSLVSGIAAHDLYHAGQIQLLKRMLPKVRSDDTG